jgi:hypothetical protein
MYFLAEESAPGAVGGTTKITSIWRWRKPRNSCAKRFWRDLRSLGYSRTPGGLKGTDNAGYSVNEMTSVKVQSWH